MNFVAKVVNGMGKGAFFVAMPFYQKQVKKKLGFEPFPGTLNVKMAVKDKKKITATKGIRIVDKGGKGGAWCFPILLDKLPCFAIIPDKSTHEKNVLEILSQYNLRKKLHIRSGCKVRIHF